MPAAPFECAWKPLQRLKMSLISVSCTAKVQGSKVWQITGKWRLGNNQQQQGWSNTGQRSQCSPQDKGMWQAASRVWTEECNAAQRPVLTRWSGPADGCQLLRQKLPQSRMTRSPNGLSTLVLSWLKR